MGVRASEHDIPTPWYPTPNYFTLVPSFVWQSQNDFEIAFDSDVQFSIEMEVE